MKKVLNYLKSILGAKIVEIILQKFVTAENVVKVKNMIFDKILDPIEDYCEENNLVWADKPLKIIRNTLNVPDNDAKKIDPPA